jgi:hypothetical protein
MQDETASVFVASTRKAAAAVVDLLDSSENPWVRLRVAEITLARASEATTIERLMARIEALEAKLADVEGELPDGGVAS